MQLHIERRISHAVRAALSLICTLAATVAFAQPDPGQPRTAAGRTIDAETGKVLNAAIAAFQAGQYTEAQRIVLDLDLAKLSPYERSRAEQILFNAKYGQGDYVGAGQHLRNAIEAGGLNPQEISQARYQAAQLLMSREKWREGAAALEEWFATAVTPNASPYYLLAVAYYQMDDFARALPPAQRAVDLANEPQEGWIGLLLALRLKNAQYDEAIPLLQKLVALAPTKKTYWVQLSAAYGQLGDFTNALGTMQVAYNAGLITEDSEVRRLADLLLFQNLPYRGAQVLEAAIATNHVSLDEKLYEKLANCWLAAGELLKARAPLERAAELAAGGSLFVRLGELSLESEDWPAAELAIARGFGKGALDDAGNAQLLMGIALLNQERYTEARAWFQQSAHSDLHREMSLAYLRVIEREATAASSRETAPVRKTNR